MSRVHAAALLLCQAQRWFRLAPVDPAWGRLILGGIAVLTVSCSARMGFQRAAACTAGLHDGGDGTCVLTGTCVAGFRDNGNAICVAVMRCPNGERDGGDGTCVAAGTCVTGHHDGGDGTCVAAGTCTAGYHDDGVGTCVATGCATGYHDGGGGACVVAGQCVPGYHDGGGACAPVGLCLSGYHDGGGGTCVTAGCLAGYHNGGNSTCVLDGQCATGYHNGGDSSCVASGCASGYHDDGTGTLTCVPAGTCAAGYGDGGDDTCVPSGTCAIGFYMSGSVCQLVADDGMRPIVLPVFFVPTDATLSPADQNYARNRLITHLRIAQRRFHILLAADTFLFTVEDPAVYHAKKTTAEYDTPVAFPDSAHMMAKELLDWKNENRNSSRHIFVALLVRPTGQQCGASPACMGGARPFNGRQATGGGFVQMEYASLLTDSSSPFLSTLVFFLGHAFGLLDTVCYGDDPLMTSIMSQNPAHHSSGIQESATPGVLLPEEYFLLDPADLEVPPTPAFPVFPLFHYSAAVSNPGNQTLQGVDGYCELDAMDATLGPMNRVGYQLYFWEPSWVEVEGPGAQFYSLGSAKSNCQGNIDYYGASNVQCKYDGVLICTSGTCT